MAVGPIHALGPASRFRPRFARLIAEGEEATVSLSPVDSVAAIGEPATDATTPNVGRGPIHVRRPLSRFRPRVLGAPTMPPPSTEGTVSAGSVASVAAVGSPQVLSTVSDGYVASRSITRPTSRFRPRIERLAHFAQPTGQTIFPSFVASSATVGEPAATEEFSLDGGGSLPEGWTVASSSVASAAEIGLPEVTDSGATVLAGSVVSNTIIGSPSVFSGEQIRTASVESVAVIGEPLILVVETTIQASGVASVAAVGSPDVDDGIADETGGPGGIDPEEGSYLFTDWQRVKRKKKVEAIRDAVAEAKQSAPQVDPELTRRIDSLQSQLDALLYEAEQAAAMELTRKREIQARNMRVIHDFLSRV